MRSLVFFGFLLSFIFSLLLWCHSFKPFSLKLILDALLFHFLLLETFLFFFFRSLDLLLSAFDAFLLSCRTKLEICSQINQLKSHSKKHIKFINFSFIFNIWDFNNYSHEKWMIVIILLIRDVNFMQKTTVTVQLKNFSDIRINDLVCNFIMLSHDNQLVLT